MLHSSVKSLQRRYTRLKSQVEQRLSGWNHRYRNMAVMVVGGLSVMAAVGGAYFFWKNGGAHFAEGILCSLLSGALLGVALLLQRQTNHTNDLRLHLVRSRVSTRTRWLPLLVGVVMLVLLTEINADLVKPRFLRHTRDHVQALLLVSGIGLVAVGAGGRVTTPQEGNADAADHTQRREWLILGMILLVALLVRVFALGDAVPFFVDEVHFTNPITHFDDANDVELLLPFSSVAAFPYLYPYLQWLIGAQTLGYNLAGLRIVSAIFGVLNVVALYLLARELFDRRVALLAAALLAVFPPHVHFSRLGLNNIADPFFGMMMLFFIARGLRSQGWWHLRWNFAWAGAMLGLTQYWYEGGRLLFPALVVAWGVALLMIGYLKLGLALLTSENDAFTQTLRRANTYNWRPLIKASLIFMAVALVVALPVYITLLSSDKGLLIRMQTVGVGGKEHFVDIQTGRDLLLHFAKQLRNALLVHFSVPENALYYKGGTALLLPELLPLFIIGLMWCVIRAPSRAGATLVLVWIGLTIIGNLLMQDSRIAARYVLDFPALILAVALGLRAVVDLFLRNYRRLRVAVPVLVTIGLMLFQVVYYFSVHLPLYRQQFRDDLGIDSHDALLRAAAYDDDAEVILIGEDLIPERDAVDYMDYLNPLHKVMVKTPDTFDGMAVASLDLSYNHIFFVSADDITTIRRLYAFFPQMQGPFHSKRDIPPDQELLLYYLPHLIIEE